MAKLFPVKFKGFLTPKDRIRVEGLPLGFSGTPQTSPFTAAQTIGQLIMPAGQLAYVDSVSITSDSDTPINVQFAMSDDWAYGTNSANILTKRGYVTRQDDFSVIVQEFSSPNTSLGFSVRDAITPSPAAKLIPNLSGGILTDDFFYDADLVYLCLGDSTTVGSLGTAGTYSSSQIYPWMIRDWYRSEGYSIRLINKGLGGKTSTDLENYRLFQRGVDLAADIVTYSMGINDVAATFDAEVYTTNVMNMIAHTYNFNPDRRFILCGPTPVYEDGRATRLQQLRDTAQGIVNTLADPKVTYIDLGAGFDRLDTSKYSSTDVSPNLIHPNITGHADIFNNTILGNLPTL